jgi:hypothetical protein
MTAQEWSTPVTTAIRLLIDALIGHRYVMIEFWKFLLMIGVAKAKSSKGDKQMPCVEPIFFIFSIATHS